MPLEPLLPLFHRLNREHFGGALVQGSQPLLAVRWSDGRMRRTAGMYRRGPGVAPPLGREIVLSRPLLDPLPRTALESTLCHEMIHAWVDLVLGVRESHGHDFPAHPARDPPRHGSFHDTACSPGPYAAKGPATAVTTQFPDPGAEPHQAHAGTSRRCGACGHHSSAPPTRAGFLAPTPPRSAPC